MTLDDIFYAVLEAFDIDDETYRSIKKSRDSRAVSVRQGVCWIGQNTYRHSQSEIGLYLGINHCTVWYHKKKAEDYMSYDKDYKMRINKALSILHEKEEREGQKEYSISGWVVRDKDGELRVFSNKPIREPFSHSSFWCGEEPIVLNPTLFPQITWKSEPQECEITLRLKQYGE